MAYRLLLSSLLVMAMGYLVAASQIPMDPWTAEETVNSQTLPTLYGMALVVTLLGMLWRGQSNAAPSLQIPRLKRVIGIVVLVLVFVASLSYVSLWPALAVLLFSMGWWLGERRWLLLLALAMLIPLAGWLGVEVLLGLYLPV